MAPTLNYRDPVTQDFVEVGGGGPPIGVIVPYVGSTAPDGWKICDGTAHGSAELQAVIGSANTPDLRARFVVAAGATMAAGTTGGVATVTLTAAQSGTPAHSHSASAGTETVNHTHGYTTTSAGGHTHGGTYVSTFIFLADMSNTQGGQWIGENANYTKSVTHGGGTHAHAATNSSTQSAVHSHAVTVNAASANAAASHNNLPPYYAMVYLIRAA